MNVLAAPADDKLNKMKILKSVCSKARYDTLIMYRRIITKFDSNASAKLVSILHVACMNYQAMCQCVYQDDSENHMAYHQFQLQLYRYGNYWC